MSNFEIYFPTNFDMWFRCGFSVLSSIVKSYYVRLELEVGIGHFDMGGMERQDLFEKYAHEARTCATIDYSLWFIERVLWQWPLSASVFKTCATVRGACSVVIEHGF